jgi:hypothetical protein
MPEETNNIALQSVQICVICVCSFLSNKEIIAFVGTFTHYLAKKSFSFIEQ